jgi:hypothetical protein
MVDVSVRSGLGSVWGEGDYEVKNPVDPLSQNPPPEVEGFMRKKWTSEIRSFSAMLGAVVWLKPELHFLGVELGQPCGSDFSPTRGGLAIAGPVVGLKPDLRAGAGGVPKALLDAA